MVRLYARLVRLKHLSSAIRLNSNRKPLSKTIINLSPLSPLSPLLHQCRDFKEFKQILSQMILAGFIKNKFDAKTLLKFSTDLPFIHLYYSFQIFTVIENPDTSIHNILMKAYVQRNYPHRAIHLYKLMLYRCVVPNVYTYPFLVEACAIRLSQFEGKQVHNHVFKLGFNSDVDIRSTFVDMYADCENIIDARKVFDEGPMMGSFVWFPLLDGCIRMRKEEEAENIYNMMSGKDLIGPLIFMFKVLGMVEKAQQLINEIPKDDTASWSSLIESYKEYEYYEEAVFIFMEMHANGVTMDEFVVETFLGCCTNLANFDDVVNMGKLTHGLVVKIGVESDVELQNSLICMYSNCMDILSAQKLFNAACWLNESGWDFMLLMYAKSNLVENARALFESMPEKSHVSWAVMICHSDCFSEGLALFRGSLRSGIELDTRTTSVAITSLAIPFSALDLGKCIHAYLIKNGFGLYSSESGLYSSESGLEFWLHCLYNKCGCEEDANELLMD